MNKIKEDLFLHPIRLRIVLATAGREVTAKQLADDLPDIPQATLYRHINTLAAAGILVVIRERRVHNTREKTYSLPKQGLMITPDDLRDARPEDYTRLFTQYLGMLLGYFTRYIQKGEIDLVRDNFLFQMTPLYLSDDEAKSLGQALADAVLPYLKNQPSPDRRRLILGLTSVPDVVSSHPSSEEN